MTSNEKDLANVVSHYCLSYHPHNHAIINVRDKASGKIKYAKIRHRLDQFYAVSLVDPATFEVWAESQVKHVSTRQKQIVLYNQHRVNFQEMSRLVFKWSFSWQGTTYCWVRENRLSQILECRAQGPGGEICVAQYLPRTLKNEYFGLLTVLGYNIRRCEADDSQALQWLLVLTLLMLLDRSDHGWNRDEPCDMPVDLPSKQRNKVSRNHEQRLRSMLEKDLRRSQKQMHKAAMVSQSANSSPAQSPLPSPSVSLDRPSTTLKDIARLLGQVKLALPNDATVTLPPILRPDPIVYDPTDCDNAHVYTLQSQHPTTVPSVFTTFHLNPKKQTVDQTLPMHPYSSPRSFA